MFGSRFRNNLINRDANCYIAFNDDFKQTHNNRYFCFYKIYIIVRELHPGYRLILHYPM